MVEGNAVHFDLKIYTPPSGDIVNFEMNQQEESLLRLAFSIKGKLGRAGGPDPLNVHGIYQMRKMRGRKQPLRMKWYAPTNPQTELQQANRTKFANAMASWGELTPEEKEPYNKRAKKLQIIGYNLYVKEYMESH